MGTETPLGRPERLLALSTFLLSVTIYSPILVFFYQGRGLSLFQILSLEAVAGLAQVLFEVPTGILGDRLGVKRTVFVGHALQAVWVGVLMLAGSYPAFLGGYLLLGLALALRSGATEAWMFELLRRRGREADMTRAQGLQSAASLVGRVTSALLATIVVHRMEDRWFLVALGASAVCFVASSLLLVGVPGVPASAGASTQPAAGMVRAGLRLLAERPALRRLALFGALSDPMPYAQLFLYQPYLAGAGTPATAFGFVAAAAALTGAWSARAAHRLEAHGAARALWALSLLTAVLYAFMATTRHPIASGALHVACFGLMQARYPILSSLRNRHLDSWNRATALSLMGMIEGVWGLGMQLAVGWAADVSLGTAFWLLAIVPVLGLLVIRPRASDERPAAPRPDGSEGLESTGKI